MTAKQKPVFDEDKLREEESSTATMPLSPASGRRKTKRSSKSIGGSGVSKRRSRSQSDLEARPVYLSRNDHIQAHFLVCFVALVIVRLLALRLGNKYTIPRIVESLNKASGSFLEENWYVFDYADEITKAITEILGVDLSRKYLRVGDIKKILGATKKA